jgi:hypothetical protein
MMHHRRLGWTVSGLALTFVAVTGCARDGSFEPRGSIKDSPEPAVSAPQYRQRPVSKSPVKRILPRSAEAPAAREAKAASMPAPAAPPPSAPATTSAPQPPAPKPAAPAVPRQQVSRPPLSGPQLLEEGRVLFKTGEVLAARERYVAALSAPLPDVLLELARTYDPNYLNRLPKSDADADIERARALYEQAGTLGSRPAEEDLARLQGKPAPAPR